MHIVLSKFFPMVLLQLTAAALASAQDYDFSGRFTNLFTSISWEGSYAFNQACGRMIAHNSNISGPKALRAYQLTTGMPAFNQSWSLSARVTIPYSAEGLPGGSPFTEEYAEIGIGCVFGQKNFGGGLQVQPAGDVSQRLVLCELFTNRVEVFQGEGEFPTLEESVNLSIRYDSNTKVLAFYSGGKRIMDLDIAADGQDNSPRRLDWGMQAGSVFQIAIFASSENYPVSPEVPLQMDDFSFHMDGQPPSATPTLSIARKAVELQYTGSIGQRYEIQMSCDLTNWFTIQSVFGTGGVANVPILADMDNASYRVKQ